ATQPAVVGVGGHLVGQPRPGAVDHDGVVQAPDPRNRVGDQVVVSAHVVDHRGADQHGVVGGLPVPVGDHRVDYGRAPHPHADCRGGQGGAASAQFTRGGGQL